MTNKVRGEGEGMSERRNEKEKLSKSRAAVSCERINRLKNKCMSRAAVSCERINRLKNKCMNK